MDFLEAVYDNLVSTNATLNNKFLSILVLTSLLRFSANCLDTLKMLKIDNNVLFSFTRCFLITNCLSIGSMWHIQWILLSLSIKKVVIIFLESETLESVSFVQF